jgi:hypothetical protein
VSNKIPIPAFLCLFLCGILGRAQQVYDKPIELTPGEIWEAGLPYIQNFSAGDYEASPQNWAFLEGQDGLMYVGNTYGVLEYDGAKWSLLRLQNGSIVRSMAISESGKIFVGGVGDLGYLEPDPPGNNRRV